MTPRSPILAIALVVCFAGCSSNDDNNLPKQCPPCAAGLTCNWSTGQCVAAPGCTPGQPGGANADCTAAGTCGCRAGFNDCDGDLGQAAGNGCECDKACVGAACGSTAAGQCSAEVPHACNSFSAYCDVTTSSCQSCQAELFNCDGSGPCESSQA